MEINVIIYVLLSLLRGDWRMRYDRFWCGEFSSLVSKDLLSKLTGLSYREQ